MKELHTVPLETVRSRLSAILQTDVKDVCPDDISEAAAGEITWHQFPDWYDYEDAEIARKTGLDSIPFSGGLFVVTESSFDSKIGGFMVDSSELGDFIDEHVAKFDRAFFNGDVIIIECTGSRIWMFHHEGIYGSLTSSS